MSEITAASLFTGAGGMDIGFEHAGVSILCANELNRDACDTYAANHPEVRLIRGDLAEHMDCLLYTSQNIRFAVLSGPSD